MTGGEGHHGPPGATRVARLGEIGLENFPPYLMNRIMGRYNAALRKEITGFGLTTARMRALAVLSVLDGPLMRDLAVYAVVETSTLSRTLDALERDGLVLRVADREDSRAVRIHLTQKGRETYDMLWPHLADAYELMFRGISDTERRAFVATLQTILKNVRKHPI